MKPTKSQRGSLMKEGNQSKRNGPELQRLNSRELIVEALILGELISETLILGVLISKKQLVQMLSLSCRITDRWKINEKQWRSKKKRVGVNNLMDTALHRVQFDYIDKAQRNYNELFAQWVECDCSRGWTNGLAK